jgi:hypothetical protein
MPAGKANLIGRTRFGHWIEVVNLNQSDTSTAVLSANDGGVITWCEPRY